MVRKYAAPLLLLSAASIAAAQSSAPKAALTSDDLTVGDYCTLFMAPKLQESLKVTEGQRAALVKEKERFQGAVAAAATKAGAGAEQSALINAEHRVLESEGQRIRDLLNNEQDAALQKMFTQGELKPIDIKVASGNIEFNYTHFNEAAATPRTAAGDAGEGMGSGSRRIQTPAANTVTPNAPVKPTTLAEAKTKMQPLKGDVAGEIRKAVADKTYVTGKIAGGAFGDKAFMDLPKSGAIMVGLRVGRDDAGQFIQSVQPIYLTASGIALGVQHGVPGMRVFVDLVAPPGYAVGGISVAGGGGFDSLALTYMKLDGNTLDPNDKFETDRVGGHGGGGPIPLLSSGAPIIGLVGKTKDDGQYMGVGLITLGQELTDAPAAQ